VPPGTVRIVGSVLVRNEDLFVERAIRNVAAVCDRIYAFDHVSDDRTWEVLGNLSQELDHLEVQRSRRASDSHRPLEQYAGTPTWALGVDGDELFDPAALAQLREQLLAGDHADVFRLKGHVLNCEEIDGEQSTASGYMSPPSRPITKLFNLAAVNSWTGSSQRLHDGRPDFRDGYDWDSMRYLYDLGWDRDPLRCLHVCFLRRSSLDADGDSGRRNLNESRVYDRTLIGALKRTIRRPWVPPDVSELHRAGLNWKRSWYARGERVTVDAKPFLEAQA
jgi:Glycosyl transferase family 2